MKRVWRGNPRAFAYALALIAIVMVGLAPLGHGAAPRTELEQDPNALAGQLLIAAPDIDDPRFAHTVILIVWHNAGGAFGIIINRPVEERSIASVLRLVGHADATATGRIRIFDGGPVEPEAGFILHDAAYHRAGTIDIDGRVAMTSSPEVLRDMGHGKGPAKALVAFGYTGWGPGQLEVEMARHEWFLTPEDETLLFDAPRETLWDEAFARRTRSL